MTEDVREQITPQELAFGDYGEGRWAWFSEYIKMFVPDSSSRTPWFLGVGTRELKL